MPYIDYAYYTNDYKGAPIEESAFSSLAERAADLIDQQTKDRITDYGFDNFHIRIQDLIKKANAAQVEFLQLNGGSESIHGGAELTSVKVGNFTYDVGAKQGWDNKSTDTSAALNNISPMTLGYLVRTGLLYAGVSVHG